MRVKYPAESKRNEWNERRKWRKTVRPFHPRWSQSAALNAQSYRRKQAATSAMRGNNKADRLVNLRRQRRESVEMRAAQQFVSFCCNTAVPRGPISPSYPPTQQTAPATGIDILNNRTFTSYCKQTCIGLIHILNCRLWPATTPSSEL